MRTTTSECRLIVENQILGTRSLYRLLGTVEEAQENCLEIERAIVWACTHDASPVYHYTCEPLDVAIYITGDLIRIVWHITGDPRKARERWNEILRGDLWSREEGRHG